MFSDIDARNAVRQLMQRVDVINAQRLGLAYVLAERDSAEYERLLDAAEAVISTVIQPIANADAFRGQVYAALDDENEDWCEAVLAMLNQGPINIPRGHTDSGRG
jgi:hypothetical protein